MKASHRKLIGYKLAFAMLLTSKHTHNPLFLSSNDEMALVFLSGVFFPGPGVSKPGKEEIEILCSSDSQEKAAAGIISWFDPGGEAVLQMLLQYFRTCELLFAESSCVSEVNQ